MGGIKNIIKGHINELLGNQEALATPRRKICQQCPLYHTNTFWGWAECNSKAYINPTTGDFSLENKPGYINGCGCRIESKITVANESCPAKKW